MTLEWAKTRYQQRCQFFQMPGAAWLNSCICGHLQGVSVRVQHCRLSPCSNSNVSINRQVLESDFHTCKVNLCPAFCSKRCDEVHSASLVSKRYDTIPSSQTQQYLCIRSFSLPKNFSGSASLLCVPTERLFGQKTCLDMLHIQCACIFIETHFKQNT